MSARLPMLLCLAVLATLLGAALWHDLRTRRIPNRLVLWGSLAGLALNSFLPSGAGLFDTPFGGLGLPQALAGAGAGLALLLPMYLLRAGGVLALAAALAGQRLRQVLKNTYHMMLGALLHSLAGGPATIAEPPPATGKLAYAFAIASGTALQLFLHYTHLWSLR